MILIGSSVWIDHLRSTDRDLSDLLEHGSVLCHLFVLGEMALGSLRSRTGVLTALAELPSAVVARPDEILRFIDLHRLSGLGSAISMFICWHRRV